MTPEQELRALLPRLDAAIEREILRLRGRYQLSLDEFRGLYVSDAQVDGLLRSVGIDPERPPGQAMASEGGGRWECLARRFGLDHLERDILLLALAVELDTRYPILFAYLNDDAARRKPTIDLAMRLLGEGWDGRADIRSRLATGSRLRKSGLLVAETDTQAGLQSGFAIAPVASHFLLGGDAIAAAGLTIVEPPGATPDDAQAMAALLADPDGRPTVILAGRDGTGRRTYAAAVAAALRKRLAVADLSAGIDALMAAQFAAQVEDAALLVIPPAQPGALSMTRLTARALPLFLAVSDAAPWRHLMASEPHLVRPFEIAPLDRRREQWRRALRCEGVRATAAATDAVAARFQLSQGAIRRAARDMRLAAMVPAGERLQASRTQLVEAARRQSTIDLGHLATPVLARPDWDDLVLPSGVQEQLRDFASAAVQRDRVYGLWGMGDVGRGVGRGVTALFAGASGTGKTLSAAVIARETGLDMWRIDLASVVSKYIGETERHLDQIFTGARSGDAILFFDEADALFGKRSEVKDAHDRYANIEVAYLLQRLEEHDGVVILASNFTRNIDQAFVRRLHYAIEFPLPDARLRERLWRKAFNRATPVACEIDFPFLGAQFVLAGGDIRSAALDAAFLAASDGGVVTMSHIVRAVSRQMLKQGKLPGRGAFGGWFDVVQRDAAEAAQ